MNEDSPGARVHETDEGVNAPQNLRAGAEKSRELLIDTVRILASHAEALTVVGAHAVGTWAGKHFGHVQMETTRDADLAVNPAKVGSEPSILDLMRSIGLEQVMRDRPGIYGHVSERDLPFAERTTVDLIVPEVYAGAGRRSARIDGQPRVVTRAYGLELAIHDRTSMAVATIGETAGTGVTAYVARPPALIVAKAHKVYERWMQVETRPHRLRQKDSGDIALLMMMTDGRQVATELLDAMIAYPELAEVVESAARRILEMYRPETDAILRGHMTDSLEAQFNPDDVLSAVDEWLTAFFAGLGSRASFPSVSS